MPQFPLQADEREHGTLLPWEGAPGADRSGQGFSSDGEWCANQGCLKTEGILSPGCPSKGSPRDAGAAKGIQAAERPLPAPGCRCPGLPGRRQMSPPTPPPSPPAAEGVTYPSLPLQPHCALSSCCCFRSHKVHLILFYLLRKFQNPPLTVQFLQSPAPGPVSADVLPALVHFTCPSGPTQAHPALTQGPGGGMG